MHAFNGDVVLVYLSFLVPVLYVCTHVVKAKDSRCEPSLAPFGDLTRNTGKRPLFIAPKWCGNPFRYWSLLSSVGFFVVAALFLEHHVHTPLPKWWGWALVMIAVVSTFHHMRTYKQVNDDWLRVVDVMLSGAFTALVLATPGTFAVWVAVLAATLLITALNTVRDYCVKSFIHMSIHLVALGSILFLLFGPRA